MHYSHWVELGMPANNVDYHIIEAIRDRYAIENDAPGIAVLLRLHDRDIDRASEVMKTYPQSMAHLFLGVSEEHRRNRFAGKMSKEDYIRKIYTFAKKTAERPEFSRIMFSPEDSFRAYQQDPEFFLEVLQAADEGYADGNKSVGRSQPPIFNLPDTTGGSTIMQFDLVITGTMDRFPDADISIHGHNDSQTANGQALDVYERRGVRFIQTTFGETGERNGIARTDIAIKVFYENGWLHDPRIVNEENLRLLDPTTNTICALLGREPPEDLYRCNVSTAGIHTDLARKDSRTYHIFGARYGSKPILELGPTSGSKQVMDVLDANGILYRNETMEAFTDMLKDQANKRKSPLSEAHICYEAQIFFNGLDTAEMLRDITYSVHINDKGHTVLSMDGKIGNHNFSKIKENGGTVEAAIDLLNEVMQEAGQKPVDLVGYLDRQIPVLGSEYHSWEPNSRPKLLHGMGKDAKQAVFVTLNDGTKTTMAGWITRTPQFRKSVQ